jgi:hypothetical protein
LRDSRDGFKPLEVYFGKLSKGMAFGESVFLEYPKLIQKFYHAYALTDCIVL